MDFYLEGHVGYRDVVRRWASVHSPSLAHSRGTPRLQPPRDIADRTCFRKLLKTHFYNSLP